MHHALEKLSSENIVRPKYASLAWKFKTRLKTSKTMGINLLACLVEMHILSRYCDKNESLLFY